MNHKEKVDIKELHKKIEDVDSKLDKFLNNEWVHMVKKVTKLDKKIVAIVTDMSWVKKLAWVIIAALLALLGKAFL